MSKYKEIKYNDYTADYIIDFRAMCIVENNIKESMKPNLAYIDEYFENIKKNGQKIPSLDDIGEITKLIVTEEEGGDIINYKKMKILWIKNLSKSYSIPESTIEEKIGRISDKLLIKYNQWKAYKVFLYFIVFCISCGFVKVFIDSMIQKYLLSFFVFILPFYLFMLFRIKESLVSSNPLLPKNIYKHNY
ncbi:hypothetical protein H6G64_35430 [Calothrix sp. FACHB-156]|nr:hypothetical protein [Calothrix sp. FACHB-156]